jgi:ABC-type nitrate/sulfonate/bicarbonate transport system permease component
MLSDGLFCSFFLLTLVAIIKSILCLVVYQWMLWQDYFSSCTSEVEGYAIACLAANFIGLALGIFLLVFAFVHNLYFSEN